MNIHEHQAKEILKKYGAVVPEGVYALNVNELIQKVKILNADKYVLTVSYTHLTLPTTSTV